MSFVLIVVRGPDQGKKLALEPGKTYTLGCNEDASLVLTDPLVLKGHCSLEVADAAVVLKNHTATAGTFVGDQKVSQATLKANHTFRIGATTLGIAAAPTPPPKPKPATSATPDPLVGRIIGGYKLNELVGAGGMGKVYRATQLSLHRDVAFKVLRDQHVKDKNFRDLFINEARAAAQLIHPNVVQVYDAGTEGDLVFFSMEFLGKGSIEEILQREKKIPWEQAILQVLEAAHGLAYAESKGIVHRDIKPDNLMLNEDGQVKIADLGLAKRGEGEEDAGVIGTPHFIPPEQALGKAVDHRADIYSLGATFFRMITGTTLYSGKTAKEIVLKHIKEPPPAASSIDETIPDDLDLVIAKMLAKDPDKRYQSATEVIAALEEVCAHHGIKGAIIKRGVGKRVLIPLVLLLVLAGGAVYYLVSRGPETVKDPVAEARAREEQQKREEAEKRRIEAERDQRKSDAQRKLLMREKAKSDLAAEVPIRSVYDDATKAPQLEDKWNFVANELEDFGNSEQAKEFEEELELSSKALRQAKGIREDLARWKESAEDKREKQEAKLKEAKEIDTKLRTQLAEMRAKQQYQRAANLCEAASTEKPRKDDPFGPVVTWKWVSPVNPDLTQEALDFPKIKQAVADSREYFRKERLQVVREAQTAGQAAIDEAAKLGEEADPAAIDAAIQKLVTVRGFRDDDNPDKVEEIEKLVTGARKEQLRLEDIKTRRLQKILSEDRIRIRDTQRKVCSLDKDVIPNNMMVCAYQSSIGQWTGLLTQDQLKSELYKRFAKERIVMAGWCEYIFARFYVDLLLTTDSAAAQAPLKSLDIDLIPFPDGDTLKDTKLTGKDTKDRFEFGTERSHDRQSVFRYEKFPMDWVYNSVFLRMNEPRWAQMTPEMQFGLAAFCFETMQYKEAARWFDEVLKNGPGPYEAAARSLKERALREAQVLAAYESLIKEYGAATASTALEQLKTKVAAFCKDAEGTIFFLDVMDPTTDELKTDFFKADYPEVPQAPPPPEPKS
jgi:tRNA A-37 threonylcarbamoyl transferase component Bud32